MAQNSRIGAGVTYVYPLASASAQNIVASAAVVQNSKAASSQVLASVWVVAQEYQAVASYVIPSALLSYISIVLQAELDPIGRNPFLRDIFIVGDLNRLSVGKRFAEAKTASDQLQPLQVRKGLTESKVVTDVKTFGLFKNASESVNTTDDIFGVADADDQQVMFFSKTLTPESASSSDLTLKSFGSSISDNNRYTSDGPNLYETYALTYFAEDYCRASCPSLFVNKALADTGTTSDSLTRSSTKSFADVFSKTDSNSILVGKSLSDTSTNSDSSVRGLGKFLADSFTKSDSIVFATGKGLTDSFTKSDSAIRATGKSVTDAATSSESKTLVIGKSLSDTVISTDDFYGVSNADDDETMLFNKTSSDVVTKSDSTIKTAGKGLTDSVSKSDSGLLVWTDYWDINYTVTSSEAYVGNSQTF